jgi:hypothetical protein
VDALVVGEGEVAGEYNNEFGADPFVQETQQSQESKQDSNLDAEHADGFFFGVDEIL